MGNLYIGGNSGGSGTYKIQTVTATTSVNSATVTGWSYMVLVDCTNNNMTLTIPSSAVASYKGENINVKRIDNSNNTCVIVPSTSSESIEGVVNNKIYLYNQNDSVTLTSLGTGDSKISSDNRNSPGSSVSFAKLYKSTPQTSSSGGLTLASSGTINTASNLAFDSSETTLGSSVTYTTNGVITLKPNLTFKLEGFTGALSATFAGGWLVAQWGKSLDGGTTWSYIGNPSYISALGNDTPWESGAGDEIARATITTTQTTLVKLILVKGNGISGLGTDGGTISPVSLPWCQIEEVSRASTVISTVDYFLGRMNTLLGFGADGNVYVDVPIVKLNGNLSSTSPYITLTAGKTYILEASLAIRSTWAQYGWFDSSNNSLPNVNYGATGSLSSSDATSITPSIATITPSSNMQVKLRMRGLGLITSSMATDITNSTIKVTQVGSSAVSQMPLSLVSGITDQASSKYFDIGNMRIQWGVAPNGSYSKTITLPAPFANNAYTVTANVDNNANEVLICVNIASKTTTSFNTKTFYVSNSVTFAQAGDPINWIAIGLKP